MRFVYLTLALCGSWVYAQESKPSKPSQADLDKATQEISSVFAADSKKATTAAMKTALATKMLGAANDAKEQPPIRWALFSKSRELAINAQDVPLAFRTIDDQTKAFTMDAYLIQVDTVERLAKMATNHKTLLNALTPVLDQAIDKDDLETGTKLATIGAQLSFKLRDSYAQKLYETEQQRCRNLAKALKEFKDKLGEGKYYAFHKDDWERGLAILEKTESELGALAKRDRMNTTDGKAELGDAWYAFAEKAKGVERIGALRRAYWWYRQGLGERAGVAKVKLEQRMQQVFEEVEKADAKEGIFSLWAGQWRWEWHSRWVWETAISLTGRVDLLRNLDPDGKDTWPKEYAVEMAMMRYGATTAKSGEVFLLKKGEIDRLRIDNGSITLDRYALDKFPKTITQSATAHLQHK